MNRSPQATDAVLQNLDWVRGVARALLDDDASANDLVQDTWLRARSRSVPTGAAGRRWLARVMGNLARDQRRGRARRVFHEQAAARPEALPSDETLREAVDVRERLARWVTELEQPYRRVALLHWMEGLDKRSIADREGVPLATVRSQVSRARQLLRDRAERERGSSSAAWLGLAAGIQRPGSVAAVGAPTVALLTGLVLMKVATLVALTAVAIVALWFKWDSDTSVVADSLRIADLAPALVALDSGPGPDPAQVEPVFAREALRAAHPGTAIANDPNAPGSLIGLQEPAKPYGQLRVVVLEQGSLQPAAGVAVEIGSLTISSEGADWNARRYGVTDSRGRVVLHDVPAGQFIVNVFAVTRRGAEERQEAAVEIGETTTVTFVVEKTRTAHGHVVDTDGRRIAGARIWMVHVGVAGLPVATSAANGAFEIPYLHHGVVPLAATAANYAPSPNGLWGFPGSADKGVVLTLSPQRGCVFGRVIDGQGDPVDGADLSLTFFAKRREPRAQLTKTTEDGLFEFLDTPIGSCALDGRVPGGALTRATLTVTDGGQHEVNLELIAGGTIRGRLTTPEGTPWTNASVSTSVRLYSPLEGTHARVAADGRFELSGQLPGEVEYTIDHDRHGALAEATLHLVEGHVTEWNPVVAEPHPLHGYVRSSDGSELIGWQVNTQTFLGPEPNDSWRTGRTKEGGRFEVMPHLGSTFRIRVYAPGTNGSNFAFEMSDVTRDAAPFHIVVPKNRIPSGTLTGRLVDLNGAPVAAKVRLVIAENTEQAAYLHGTSEGDGHFEIRYVPEGSGTLTQGRRQDQDAFRMVVPAVPPGTTHDVGDVPVAGS